MTDAFGKALSSFGKQVVEDHRKLCGVLALKAMDKLVTRSPVDRGFFRKSWVLDEDAPSGYVPPETDSGTHGPPDLAKAAAVAEGCKPYPRLIVSNAAPYGERLADGHSPQAPEGWVDVVVEELAALGKR